MTGGGLSNDDFRNLATAGELSKKNATVAVARPRPPRKDKAAGVAPAVAKEVRLPIDTRRFCMFG